MLLHSYFSGKEPLQVVEFCKEMNTLEFKKHLAELIDNHIGSIREQYVKLKSNPKRLEELIEYGNQRARKIAIKNLEEIKNIVGFAQLNKY